MAVDAPGMHDLFRDEVGENAARRPALWRDSSPGRSDWRREPRGKRPGDGLSKRSRLRADAEESRTQRFGLNRAGGAFQPSVRQLASLRQDALKLAGPLLLRGPARFLGPVVAEGTELPLRETYRGSQSRCECPSQNPANAVAEQSRASATATHRTVQCPEKAWQTKYRRASSGLEPRWSSIAASAVDGGPEPVGTAAPRRTASCRRAEAGYLKRLRAESRPSPRPRTRPLPSRPAGGLPWVLQAPIPIRRKRPSRSPDLRAGDRQGRRRADKDQPRRQDAKARLEFLQHGLYPASGFPICCGDKDGVVAG